MYVYVFPMQTLAGLRGSVLDRVADRLLGAAAGDVMGIVAIISLAASISAMVFAGPRVYYAMARDGLFFPRAARVHPRYRTPAVSIAAQAAWSALLVLSAKADALVNYTGFAVVLFSGIAGVALFVLRWRYPAEARPFRAWGYPVAPGVFVLASALIVLNAIWRSPRPSGAGVAIILAGLPFYWYLRREGAGLNPASPGTEVPALPGTHLAAIRHGFASRIRTSTSCSANPGLRPRRGVDPHRARASGTCRRSRPRARRSTRPRRLPRREA